MTDREFPDSPQLEPQEPRFAPDRSAGELASQEEMEELLDLPPVLRATAFEITRDSVPIAPSAFELGPPCNIVASTAQLPFSPVALLRVNFGPDSRRGTAFFIRPGVLLTAGHNTFANGVAPDSIDVFPSFNGQDITSARFFHCRTFAPAPEFKIAETAGNDYGVILLGSDIGAGTFGARIATTQELAGLHVEMVSYPQSDLRQRHCTGAITQNVQAEDFFYAVRTDPGSSGAPVFLAPDNPRIVAIHVSGPSNAGNQGTRITQRKIDQIQRWITHGIT